MPAVEINGASLEYHEDGAGEPLVLVHGSASDYRTWQAQRDAFARHYRTIVYSRRYHWPNATIAPDADYSMIEHVDDLRAFLTTLKVAPVRLVGHSYGGFVSLLLAIREPGLLRSLVLAEPPVVTLLTSLPPKPLELLKLAATRPRTAAALIRFVATGIGPATAAFARDDITEGARLFGTAVLGKKTFQAIPTERREQARVNTFKAEFLGSGFPPVAAEDIRRIATPTLLVAAEHSPALILRLTDRLQELLPHAERVKIPAASHNMHEGNPSAFNAAVLAFLAQHTAVPSAA